MPREDDTGDSAPRAASDEKPEGEALSLRPNAGASSEEPVPSQDDKDVEKAGVIKIISSGQEIDEDEIWAKRGKTRQLKTIGKLTMRLIQGLEEYFDEHDLDDLSDEEESMKAAAREQQQAEASPRLLAQEHGTQAGDNDDVELAPTTEKPPIGPKYKADMYKYVKDRETNGWNAKLVTTLDEAVPEMVEEQDDLTSPLTSTFEVTTMYSLAKSNLSGGALSLGATDRDGTVKAHAKLGTFMVIHSAEILADIRQVVDYYPESNFRQSPLVLVEPFCLLLHYKQELTELLESRGKATQSTKTEGEGSSISVAGADTPHIAPMLQYIALTYDSAVSQEKARWKKERPMCTFEWLWLLFRPGSLVVSWKNDIPYAYTISSHNKEEKPDGKGRVKPPELGGGSLKFIKWPRILTLKMWSIDFDGKTMGRLAETVIIQPFEGEKAIDALPLIPLDHWKDSKNGVSREALKERLVKRGKEFFNLTKRTYCQYDGKGVSYPNRMINGRIMIDSELCYSGEAFGGLTLSRPNLGFEESQDRVESVRFGDYKDPVTGRVGNVGTIRTHSDDLIDPFKTESLTDQQYAICSPSLWGFVTKLRKWELLDVEKVSPLVIQKNLIDDLVLEEEAKDMIKALSRSYTTSSETKSRGAGPGRWSADFVQNKGDGQIFLLHGKPGVGKTTTAECVSELTQRPLLSLTCGDLGTDPIKVESKLMQWLRLGTVWEAILLLDEADVYLESRRAQDLQRNSLVSIFLRALEYYQGILFLTSNRVGTFDDAFISRIHVIIHYPPFQPEQRAKIWKTFFRRLENERPNIRITPSVYDYISTDEGLNNLEWNGREIRNAFNTAVALAEYENDAMDFHGQQVINFHRRHLEQVVKMSKAFQQYLTKTHGADEARRAKLERIRDDTAGGF